MSRLTGKRAIVTGGSRGIGAAIALRLAEDGADVAITYEASADKANEVVASITALGRKGLAIQADGGDAEAVKNAVEKAAAALGGLDILVNNAGIARGAPIGSIPLEDIDRVLAVNVRGVILATQAAVAHIGEGGRIITIGSCLAERVTGPYMSLYAASKSALIGFTKGIARDLGPKGITANIVHPGPTDTDMNPATGPQADGMRASMAIPSYSTPQDVAGAVAWLASDEGRFVTGTGLTIDSGVNA